MHRQEVTFFSCLEGFIHSYKRQTFFSPLFNESLSPREDSQQLQNCVVHGVLKNSSISYYKSARNYMKGNFFPWKSVGLAPQLPEAGSWLRGIFQIHEQIPETASEQNLTLGTAWRHITAFFHTLRFSQHSHHSCTQVWIQHYDRHRSGWNKPDWGPDPARLQVKLAICGWKGCATFRHWQSWGPSGWINSPPFPFVFWKSAVSPLADAVLLWNTVSLKEGGKKQSL